MDANQYLKNQIILENCKEYLLPIHYLPEMYDILGKFDYTEPYQVDAFQNVEETKNSILISFDIQFLVDGSSLCLKVKIVDGEISKLSFLRTGINYEQYSNLERTVQFMNHEVCKVVDHFTNNCSYTEKERVFYYRGRKQIYKIERKTYFDQRFIENIEFIEEATSEPVCGLWMHDVYYERIYRLNTCMRQKYHADKEKISHNQFDKKNKGVLKRIKKLGQQKV